MVTDETLVPQIERSIRAAIAEEERGILLANERIKGLRKALICVADTHEGHTIRMPPQKGGGEN